MIKKTLFFALSIALAPAILLAESSNPTEKPDIYVVKKGDCLWKISKKVWGDPTKWALLYATNEGKIQNPNLIYPGQKFTIPTTITKEELKKAIQLAEAKAAPLGVRSTGPEGTQLAVHKISKPANQIEEVAPSTASKETAPAASEKTSAPPAATQENQLSTSTPESTGSSGKIISLLLALVALAAGLFFWMRSRPGPTADVQTPRPVSSFPPTGEQGQRPSTPFSTSQAYPAPKPVTPPQPEAIPSTPPPSQPLDKPAAFSVTITSVSTPAPSAPTVSQPAQPATQLPLTPPTPAQPETQAESSSPVTPAAEENKPAVSEPSESNRPSDTPPPSSSNGHAA